MTGGASLLTAAVLRGGLQSKIYPDYRYPSENTLRVEQRLKPKVNYLKYYQIGL